MVPDATFTSTTARRFVKATPWEADIPSTSSPAASRAARRCSPPGGPERSAAPAAQLAVVAAAGGITTSLLALVHDLVARALLQHAAGLQADLADVGRHVDPVRVRPVRHPGRGHGGAQGPAVAVRRGQRAGRPLGPPGGARRPRRSRRRRVVHRGAAHRHLDPAWHDAHRELPFVFVGSAAAASGGLAMALARPLAESGPARALAVIGATVELVVEHRMEGSMGLSAEALHLRHARAAHAREQDPHRGRCGRCPAAGPALACRRRGQRPRPRRRFRCAPVSACSRRGRSQPGTRATP